MVDVIVAMRAVADRLHAAGLPYAFVGGSIANVLLDHPELTPARPTDDVDVLVELAAGQRYSLLEQIIRSLGFQQDVSAGAPLCRWKLGELTVDVAPTVGDMIGLDTRWFTEALAGAEERLVRAFFDRGAGDYYGSRDLEDVLTVIDGREEIFAEVDAAEPAMRRYIRDAIAGLLEHEAFDEALSGALPADAASQARLPSLRRKLRAIAALA